MADLRGRYDSNADPSSGAEVLPAGLYTVKITGGDWKENSKKTGKFLQVNMQVVDGPHSGAIIIDRFNLDNPSRDAVQIANAEFAALRKAVGVQDPKDTTDLIGPRFQVMLKCEKRNDDPSKMANRVQRYIERGQAATTPQQNQKDPPWNHNAPPKSAPQRQQNLDDEIPF